ncbi:unnamed protein product [Linum trigynum]|uniref:Aminotransferase-like plant mobile domain-containing protein n=1 Tax=Linum trigynum TaxID=586398 RepID=A0AAV2DXM4_9ROSI
MTITLLDIAAPTGISKPRVQSKRALDPTSLIAFGRSYKSLYNSNAPLIPGEPVSDNERVAFLHYWFGRFVICTHQPPRMRIPPLRSSPANVSILMKLCSATSIAACIPSLTVSRRLQTKVASSVLDLYGYYNFGCMLISRRLAAFNHGRQFKIPPCSHMAIVWLKRLREKGILLIIYLLL